MELNLSDVNVRLALTTLLEGGLTLPEQLIIEEFGTPNFEIVCVTSQKHGDRVEGHIVREAKFFATARCTPMYMGGWWAKYDVYGRLTQRYYWKSDSSDEDNEIQKGYARTKIVIDSLYLIWGGEDERDHMTRQHRFPLVQTFKRMCEEETTCGYRGSDHMILRTPNSTDGGWCVRCGEIQPSYPVKM